MTEREWLNLLEGLYSVFGMVASWSMVFYLAGLVTLILWNAIVSMLFSTGGGDRAE